MSGQVIQQLSFDAWGNYRYEDWVYTAPNCHYTDIGYTGHKELCELGLVDMNARLYDPVLGRFISSDTMVPNPDDMQSFNRYSYALNSPLVYTDPSGHGFFGDLFRGIGNFFKSIGSAIIHSVGHLLEHVANSVSQFIKQNWKTVATIGLAIFAGWAAPIAFSLTTGFALGSALFSGGAYGFTYGVVGSLLNGCSLSQALVAGVKGGTMGIISGVNYGIGNMLFGLKYEGADLFVRSAVHGIASGLLSVAQGGKFGPAFLGSALSEYSTPWIDTQPEVFPATVATGLIGGSSSLLSGGNFAQGFMLSAFTYQFNDLLHRREFAENAADLLETSSQTLNTLAAARRAQIELNKLRPQIEQMFAKHIGVMVALNTLESTPGGMDSILVQNAFIAGFGNSPQQVWQDISRLWALTPVYCNGVHWTTYYIWIHHYASGSLYKKIVY
jgi:RHS repeat-associated protein